MNELLKKFLTDKPLLVPKSLFQNYSKLNLTEQELIVIICLINQGTKPIYNPSLLTEEIGLDKYKAMQILNDLSEKNIIQIKVENNPSGKKEEYIYLDILYNKLINLELTDKVEEENPSTDLFTTFEQELGRTLSPMEVEIIKEWLHDGTSEELIQEALKEAIYNNVRNLKYIDRILFTWKQKGIKNKAGIVKDKKNYQKKPDVTKPIYDYNWLEEE